MTMHPFPPTLWRMTLLLPLLLLALFHHNGHALRRLPQDLVTRSSSTPRHHGANHSHNNVTMRSLAGKERSTSTTKKVTVPLPLSPEEHRVRELPFLHNSDFPTAHYAGLLPANDEHTKFFFYWLFYHGGDEQHKEQEVVVDEGDDIPLVVWMNGGPGCSSNDGLFLEHGPFRLTTTTTTSNKDNAQNNSPWKMNIHKQSWHTAPAYIVYVDQPVGTGLSFTLNKQDYPSNDEQVNTDFDYWLRSFLTLHSNKFLPQRAFSSSEDAASAANEDKTTSLQTRTMKRPLYFSGESHAGHYIPSMIHYIHSHNPDASSDTNSNNNNDSPLLIRVDGAAIGNGWVDPYHQYAGAEASYGHGLIDLAQKQALDQQEKDCQAQLQRGNYHYNGCMNLLDDIVAQSEGKHGTHRVSQYDVRKWEEKHASRVFPLGHDRVEAYLGGWPTSGGDPPMGSDGHDFLESVLTAIHAMPSHHAGQRYQECTDPPYNALKYQDGLGVVDDVVALLHDGVKLLFFNGMEDLICNHVGNEVMLMKLPWRHRDDWIEAPRYSWTATGETSVSGYNKEFENLSYLKVLHSGHMVPMDVPDVALDMMRNFLYGKSFQSAEQQLDRAKEEDSANADCPVCPTCDTTTTTSAGKGETEGQGESSAGDDESNSMLRYVVAHSWIGAVIAVSVFVGALLYVKRRQTRAPTIATRRTYGNLEMKEGPRYHDEPPSTSSDDEVETNGNGII